MSVLNGFQKYLNSYLFNKDFTYVGEIKNKLVIIYDGVIFCFGKYNKEVVSLLVNRYRAYTHTKIYKEKGLSDEFVKFLNDHSVVVSLLYKSRNYKCYVTNSGLRIEKSKQSSLFKMLTFMSDFGFIILDVNLNTKE